MNTRFIYWVGLMVFMSVTVRRSNCLHPMHKKMSQFEEGGTKWAFLVAGSTGYSNYRHQADVCHAYQVLKNGGLKDENIIVMMYDDIAYNEQNPRPGVIINQPDGPNVYIGVPKDYTGNNTNANNFFAVLTGNKNALTGGSGKVLQTGPNDTIFIYIAAHGNAGFIAMPDNFIWGKDFAEALKKKYDAKSYKNMVIYIESCLSGSMLEGLLPNDINIYATTSSNATENSYAFYCPNSSTYYTTCLGDRYSISWLEDSDQNDRTKETLNQQYFTVYNRTYSSDPFYVHHVMQYGDLNMRNDFLATYLGGGLVNVNDNYNFNSTPSHFSHEKFNTTRLFSQEDAHLLHLKLKLEKTPDGSKEKLKAQTMLDVEIAARKNVDHNVYLIWNLIFGEKKSSNMIVNVRSNGQPLVDDWDCLKMLVNIYERRCGIFSTYGLKYSRAFANMCNAGISEEQMIVATSKVCPEKIHFS